MTHMNDTHAAIVERLTAGLERARGLRETVREIVLYSTERVRARYGTTAGQGDPVERVLVSALGEADVRLRDAKRELALRLLRRDRLRQAIEHADIEISNWERRAAQQEEQGDMALAAEARKFRDFTVETMRVPRVELARVTVEIDRVVPLLRALRHSMNAARSLAAETAGRRNQERRQRRRERLVALVETLDALEQLASEPPTTVIE